MLPQVHVQVLAATLMAFGGGALGGNQDTAYEGGVAMNKISAFVRTDSEALNICKPGRTLTRERPHWHPELRLPASIPVRSKHLVFKSLT